jgi:multidrug efflux system outer membrane protein
LADLPWKDVFKDPVLQDLIRTALANNLDLRIAVTRIEQARAIQAEVFSGLLPHIGYEGALARGKNSFLGDPKDNNGITDSTTIGAFTAAWEIDLWGRIRKLNEAALARFLASEEARRGVALTLLSDVAQAYFDLLALDERLKVARRAADTYAETLALFKDRLEGGKGSVLSTSRAEGAFNNSMASVHDLIRAIAEIEDEICVLLGQAPTTVPRGSSLFEQGLLPETPAGLPSQLLERRPDILAAELEVRARNAEIGSAIAEYFPRIGLTTLLGKVTPNSGLAVGSSMANLWSIAATLSGPIFEGGRLRAQEDQARAQWQEAVLQYQKTVLVAFQEVSRSLVAREELAQAFDRRSQAVRAYELAVETSNERFNAGRSSYYEVLEAQQLLFPTKDALIQTRLGQAQTLVLLYKALGGGWVSVKAQ